VRPTEEPRSRIEDHAPSERVVGDAPTGDGKVICEKCGAARCPSCGSSQVHIVTTNQTRGFRYYECQRKACRNGGELFKVRIP